jgi:hypothetical protein
MFWAPAPNSSHCEGPFFQRKFLPYHRSNPKVVLRLIEVQDEAF